MCDNATQEDNLHNLSQITHWLNQELYDKAKHDELPLLFVELRWLLERASQLRFFVSGESSHFQPIIDSVNQWILTIQNNKKIAQLSQSQVESIELNGIQNQNILRDKKKRQLIAFLASRGQNDKVNDYRATYLLLCLEMAKLTKFTSRINDTLDNTRFLTDKNREFLLPFLPTISEFDSLFDLHKTLDEIKQSDLYGFWQSKNTEAMQAYIKKVRERKPRKGATLRIDTQSATDSELVNFKIKEEIQQFFLPVDNYVNQNTGIVKQKKSKPETIEPEVIENESFTDDITGDVVLPLSTINENIENDVTNNTEINEPQHEIKEAYNQVTPKKRISPAVDIIKAKQQSDAMRKNSMYLSTDTRVASDYEIDTLIKELYAVLSQINIDYSHSDDSSEHNESLKLSQKEQICIFLLAVLLSGSTQIFKTESWWQNAYYVAKYEFSFTPARAVLDDRFNQDFSQKNKLSLNLFFPEKVSTLLYVFANSFNLDDKDEFDEKYVSTVQNQATEYLKKINKAYQTRLSFNKVLDYLKVTLTRRGEDNAIIDIIRMQPIHQTAALSYINASQMNMIYTHQTFFRTLQKTVNVEEQADNLSIHDYQDLALVDLVALPEDEEFYRDDIEPQMGTALLLNEEKLKNKWILPLKDKLLALFKITDVTPEKFVERHNFFMDYLYVLMGLSSGYRPVIETFGRLQDIDMYTSAYFISDKENRVDDGIGRFIYLPEIAVLQIKNYIAYLHQYSQFYYRKQQIVAQEFDKVLHSQQGIILYLTIVNDQIIAESQQNNPWIAQRLAQYANLPLNWYRHHIRSLKNTGMSLYGQAFNDINHFTPDIIGAWMGHTDELGYDYFDITSGLKRSQLQDLASLINTKLAEYGFEAIDMCQWINLDKESRNGRVRPE